MYQVFSKMGLQITNEDNMELMARYEDNYFDLAIVDPPYGIERFKKVTENYSEKDVHAKRFQKMETVNNNKPLNDYWNDLFRVSKNQIIWGANNFALPPSEYFLCWNKEQAMPNFATLEYAWVSMGLKKPAKLFTYSIHKHNQTDKIHPTQKPVKLYEWLLMNYAKEGDKILDTHLGSGSIAIACHNLGFDLTACELDKDYYEAALKRIEQHQAQQRLF
jgi:site-specific DNA-methyltransferase (adenine-specific)